MMNKWSKNATHIYLISYMEALEKVKNPNLAVQCAMAVTTVLVNRPQAQQSMNPLGAFFAAMMKEATKRSDRPDSHEQNEQEGDGDNE